MTVATKVIWKSKNEMWEVTLEGNDLILYFRKNQTKYSIEVKKGEFWQTYTKTIDEIPAYVQTAIERNYLKLYQEGEIM